MEVKKRHTKAREMHTALICSCLLYTSKFNRMCGTIRRTLNGKVRSLLKFYKENGSAVWSLWQ